MNYQDYWRKREEKWIAQQIKDDAKQSKVIAEKYQRALDQIEKEISANWERFAGKEGVTLSEAKKMAYEMDVKAFARKAKQYVKDKDFSKTANDELRLYNVTMRTSRLELLKKQLSLELLVLNNDMDRYCAKTLTEAGNTEAERQAGILGETVFPNYTDAVDSIVNASFQGATFSERIWGSGGALKADLDRLLIRSVTQGRNPRELARELRNIFDSSRYEAERLMRTETARVQVAIQEKSYQEYGIEEFEFVAEPSACDACKPLDGKIFEVSKLTVGLNAPPIHPHCRCSTVPHVDREALERRLAEIDKANEKAYNGDEYNFKEIFEKNGMKTAVGENNFNDFIEHLSNNPNENVRRLFGKYGNQVTFSKLSNAGGNYATGSNVQLNQKAFDGGKISNPFQVVYHEITHAIDSLGVKSIYGNKEVLSNHFKKIKYLGKYENWQMPIRHISDDPKYKLGETITRDLWEYANGKGCLTLDDLGPKPRKKAEKEAWLKKQEEVFKNHSKLQDKINSLKPEAKENEKIWSNISDIIEGTRALPGDYVFGVGHGKSYWTDGSSQTTEFFAEVTDALAANPKEYENIKKLFPNAVDIYHEIIEELLGG